MRHQPLILMISDTTLDDQIIGDEIILSDIESIENTTPEGTIEEE